MTLNPYDEGIAAAYKAVREIPRDGLLEWRDAVAPYVTPGMKLVDLGAGTGQFASAFTEWFDITVVAIEPSAAMRERIAPNVRALAGDASGIPLPDASADGIWISCVLQHVPDLGAAAREIRRVLRPGSPVLIRAGMSHTDGDYDGIEMVRWFPETTRVVDSFPSVDRVCDTFADAGFARVAYQLVRETRPGRLLDEVDALRHADTTLRALTDDEYRAGKERLQRAGGDARENWLDFLVLR